MRPKPGDIANHLADLAQAHNLSAATLKTRRAAIRSVLSAKGDKAIATDPLVSAVLKGARQPTGTTRLKPSHPNGT